MENEQLIAILNEVLEEQKKMQCAQAEINAAFQKLTMKIEGIEEAEKTRSKTTTAFDVKPIQQMMNSNTTEIKLWIQTLMSKPKSDNLRVFMESDAKIWTVYLLVAIVFLTYLYLLLTNKGSVQK